jgi:abhydrolase domain-containing protein 2
MLSLVICAVVLIILFKILNVNNYPEKSMLYCANKSFLEEFLKRVPELNEPYIPTRFWGFSGHIQTIVQGVISRLACPLVNGYRVYLKLTDGATLSYDLYQKQDDHPEGGDFTLAVCPGIGNNSESVYIRRIVFNAQKHGYRVAVLNHIGTLKTVPVTSPRIFTYGNTCDYSAMVKDIVRRYRTTRIVCLGFSMGGNLVTKYIGEPRVKPSNVIAGMSVCQGYDANRAMNLLLEWRGFRRMYIYAMTENIKVILRRWSHALFTEDIRKQYGVTRHAVFNSGTLKELDDVYMKRMLGFNTTQEFYSSMSSCHHMKNIRVPMVFLNALDDPIVPPELLEIPRDVALNNENIIYIEQKFGGHLGFYEGGFIYSNPLTWVDRVLVKIGHALTMGHTNKVEIKENFELTDSGEGHPSGIWLKGLNKQNSLESESGDEAGQMFLKPDKIPFFETPVTSEMSSSHDSVEEDQEGEDTEGDLETEADLEADTESDDGIMDGGAPPTLTPPNTPVSASRARKPLKGMSLLSM